MSVFKVACAGFVLGFAIPILFGLALLLLLEVGSAIDGLFGWEEGATLAVAIVLSISVVVLVGISGIVDGAQKLTQQKKW